ncbi:Panacea domain-containing protein [Allosphingosinicella indica]|uniref:Uncharacterized phage-associated protein n=1 Tax=Allosphingosinicella indica TaxID=941907 RepID=A0A1X7GDM2_9SPHN|nr:type II toxin-antitoxin system antitoxin SocA domain-containing protein [Allosphingosinicella indica]SMF68107.1 Uncharacterized phage-associated protein [Allosphingosinicella indica]
MGLWACLTKWAKGIALDESAEQSYIAKVQYTPLALANTFVERYGSSNTLDHMKLQKLAFYAYGWWLAYNPQPVLNEPPQVWRHGPVFSSLYGALRPFGSAPITKPVGGPNRTPPTIPATDDVARSWVDWVWNRYGHLNALQLSDMTHEVGTPWQIEAAAREYRVPQHHPIPDATTRAYFKRLAANLT